MPAELSDLDILSWHYLAALGIVLLGSVVRGYTGFGSGLVMIPLLAIMWGPAPAVAVTVAIGLFSSVQMVPQAVRIANYHDIVPMGIANLLCIPVGAWLLLTLDPALTKKLIAGFILVISLVQLRGWTYSGPRGAAPSFAAGIVGGIITGLAGIGGPPVVLYIMSLKEHITVQRANIVMIMMLMGGMTFLSLLVGGEITLPVLATAGVFVVPSVLAVWFGAWLFKVLPSKVFRIFVLWMLVALSIVLLIA